MPVKGEGHRDGTAASRANEGPQVEAKGAASHCPARLVGMRWIPETLRARLSWALLLPAALVFSGLGLAAWLGARAAVEAELGARLADTAATAASTLPTGLVARFEPDNARTLENLRARLAGVEAAVLARRVFLLSPEGLSMADTAPDAPAPGEPDRALAADRWEFDQARAGVPTAGVLFRGLDGERYLRGYAPVLHEGVVVGVVGVEGSARSYRRLDALGAYLVGTALIGLGVLAALALALSRALTEPIARLDEAARRIGAGELEAAVGPAQGAVEVRSLAATMDEMRVALRARERELQTMLGGIAHEVRNPLGGIELFVGLLRDDLRERPDELALLVRVEQELGTLKRVVEEFLGYARQVPTELEAVRLHPLLAQSVALVPQDLAVTLDFAPDQEVQADPSGLGRLALNLMRNAAQAGARSMRITYGPGAVLRFRDDGPGVPAEIAERIFEAFYTTREKGTGLGLALCAKLAAAHGGRLTLENPGQAGACFALTLSAPPRRGDQARPPSA